MSSERLTEQEMREIANELNSSVNTAKNTFNVLENIIMGGTNDAYEFNGVMVPSLNMRIKQVIDQAIEDGTLEVPTGRKIRDLYIDDEGKMQILYDDDTEEDNDD